MQRVVIQVEPRNVVGRQVKTLRRAGFVPAVIYGRGFDSMPVQVPLKDFEKAYAEAGESTVVYLKVNDQDYPTIIHDVVRDAVSEAYLHADFYKVRLDEKINAKIHLNFIGESPAVKGLGGILVKNMSEIEVSGFPQDLPHLIDVDISGMTEFKSQVLIRDLPISSKLEVKTDPEVIVALVQEPISEEELKAQLEAPVAGGVDDVEVIKKEKPEEESTEEGEAAPAPTPEEK